ncbi:MAG: efflux RND transporter periplasmic adaptor subunit [Kofleriaceae bacterium]
MRATWWLVAALVLSGCKDKTSPKTEGPTASAAAKEGTLCEEHGVLEAVCTKCHPKLIPVFQAKGDWCEEHGLPMSFCPVHHPERAGRPVADVKNDGAPPHGTKVRFKTKEAAEQAGIATAIAEVRPGGARLEAIATIAYDATRRAEVNARAPGVVRALKVDLGARVTAGAPLAVIESAQVGEDRSRLDAAKARVLAAEANYKRESDMFAKGVSAKRDVEVAKQALDEAIAARNAASSSLGVVGARGGGSTYTLTSPLAGTVVRRNATIGHMVSVEEPLFEVVDTSSMWAELDVPETQLANVASGQRVTITVENLPERTFAGAIDYVAPEIDATTRTAKARVALNNPDGVLRANMFARADIALANARPIVMAPSSAVQRAKGVALVFVKLAPDQYEARRVELGLTQGEMVEIVAGVKPGETIATRGSFLLKTETLKGAIGAGCCDVE